MGSLVPNPALQRTASPPAELSRWASMNRTLAIIAILAVFGEIGNQSAAAASVKQLPTNEKDCKAAGGNMAQVGLPGSGAKCDIKTTDKGKVCTDSEQCQDICVAPEGAAPKSEAAGTCSEYVVEYSCYKFLKRGIVNMICVD